MSKIDNTGEATYLVKSSIIRVRSARVSTDLLQEEPVGN